MLIPFRANTVTYELIDICVNLADKSFRKDVDEVLERAGKQGVRTMFATGSDLADSRRCLSLAERHAPQVYATAGIHPHHAKDWTADTADRLVELAAHPKVLALGEMGLDFNRNYSPPEDQAYAFEAQLEIAAALHMPVFLHEREAHDRFMKILMRHMDRLPGAVVHCFTGTADELAAYLDLNLHIGITGWICDERRGRHLLDLLPKIPPERLLLETDAPYLLPRDLSPRPKSRRNEPAYLPHILETAARAMQMPPVELASATTGTARRFYNLPAHESAD